MRDRGVRVVWCAWVVVRGVRTPEEVAPEAGRPWRNRSREALSVALTTSVHVLPTGFPVLFSRIIQLY